MMDHKLAFIYVNLLAQEDGSYSLREDGIATIINHAKFVGQK
jgi:hypothetical protein